MSNHENKFPISEAEENRIAALITGYAIGELDQTGLEELYALLREPGETGHKTAMIAWEILETSTDIRAAAGTQFEDTVRHRLDHPKKDKGPASKNFLGRVAGWLGLSRPALNEVTQPEDDGKPAGSARMAMVALIALFFLALIFIVFRSAPEGIVEVISVSGGTITEGEPVISGTSLPTRPVIIPEKGTLALGWKKGNKAEVSGPANIVPHHNGLSISSGTAWIGSKTEFTIGLPDGKVELSPDSRIAIEVIGNRSQVGVSEGSAKLSGSSNAEPLMISAGHTASPGGVTAKWITNATWAERKIRESREIDLITDHGTGSWVFETTINWEGTDGEFGLGDQTANSTGQKPYLWLKLTPSKLTVYQLSGRKSDYKLSGAPMLARKVKIYSRPGIPTKIYVDGLDEEIEIEQTGSPTLFTFTKAKWEGPVFRQGPPKNKPEK